MQIKTSKAYQSLCQSMLLYSIYFMHAKR